MHITHSPRVGPVKRPAIGEIASAIILTVVFAIGVAVMITVFSDTAEEEDQARSTFMDRQQDKAKELLSVTVIGCSSNELSFTVHNLGREAVVTADLMFYQITDGGNLGDNVNATLKTIAGITNSSIEPGAFVGYDVEVTGICDSKLALITPTSQLIEIVP